MVNSLNEVEIVDVVGNSAFGAVINNNGKQEIYMWGSNSYGQLGLGDTTNRLVPTLLDSSKLGNYKSIKEFKLNTYNTTIIVDTPNGEQIYVFGRNDHGVLGISNTNNQLNPVLFDTTIFGDYNSIKDINFGGWHGNDYGYSSYSIIVDTIGKDKIFVWGDNRDGQLGIGNTNQQLSPVEFNTANFGSYASIKELQFNKRAVGYAILVRSDGKNDFYTWGTNGNGQLGIGTSSGASIPTKVTVVSGMDIKFVTYLETGALMVVTNNGIDQLYSWGYSGSAQLLLGNIGNSNIRTPRLVSQSTLFNATEIIAINGYDTVFASVKINGAIRFIAWGKNSFNGLMISDTNYWAWDPVLIDNSKLGNFTEVYDSIFTSGKIGWAAQACYAYVKTISGDKLYTWGRNSYGQLGIGGSAINGVYLPTEAKGLDLSTAKIVKFPNNWFSESNILRLERNNQIEYFGTGRNTEGQLALNNTTNVFTFTKILPARYTNPTAILTTPKLTSIEGLNLINSNNVLNTTELEKYVDTTSFPTGSTLSIDMAKTTTNLEQGILNLAITTNKYNTPLIIDTITGSKTFEVSIPFLKATNINTNPIFVREALFPNKDKITIKQLYNTICDGTGRVINRSLLDQYLDLTSIPPTAELYLLSNSLDDPIKATFTLKSNQVYLNGVTTLQAYTQPNLTISIEELMNWALIISLSAVGGALLIAALVGFILVKRNSNRIII